MSIVARLKYAYVLRIIVLCTTMFSIGAYVAEVDSNRKERELFQESLTSAEAGRWVWDMETNRLTWDDQMFNLYGINKKEWTWSLAGWISHLHPEDSSFVINELEQAVKERRGYRAIFRIVTPSNAVKYVVASGAITKDGRYMTGLNIEAEGVVTPAIIKKVILNNNAAYKLNTPDLSVKQEEQAVALE